MPLYSQQPPVFEQSPINSICRWAYDYPKAVKAIMVSILLLGAALLLAAAIPSTSNSVRVGLIASGLALGMAVFAASKVFPWVVPPKHAMTSHVFTESTYAAPGVEAQLQYVAEHIPMLTIRSDSFKKAGFAHGYLVGNELNILLNQWDKFLRLHPAFPSPEKMTHLSDALTRVIPQEYLEEMEGIVEGYNARMEVLGNPDRMTMNKCMLIHLVPEYHHFNPAAVEHALATGQTRRQSLWSAILDKIWPTVGCTVVIGRDKEKNQTIVARNMDWPSGGVAGTFSILIQRTITCPNAAGNIPLPTVAVGMPGLVGCATGMNSEGLCVAMNICKGKTQVVEGMPALFANDCCLKYSKNLEEATQWVHNNSVLGSYHLSVADKNGARSFHMYQNEDGSHYVRDLEESVPLVVTNCRYSPQGPYSHHFASAKREKNIAAHFNNEGEVNERSITQVTKIPVVNNSLTVHHVMLNPNTKCIEVAFNNGFAGDEVVCKLDLTPFWGSSLS